MPATAESPLSLLVGNALESLGACDVDPAMRPAPETPSETVEQIAAALLISMGLGEIAADLDLRAVALLGAAAVAGLQRIEEEDPGRHDSTAAILALEDLLRRTAEGSR
jgi:hypothetical protein